MKDDDLRRNLLEIEEIKLKAQLRAVRELLKEGDNVDENEDDRRKSQVEYVYELLKESKKPMHITDIINQVKETWNIDLYRESIVSAILKKVNRFDRFCKTGKNTFGLIEYRTIYNSDSV